MPDADATGTTVARARRATACKQPPSMNDVYAIKRSDIQVSPLCRNTTTTASIAIACKPKITAPTPSDASIQPVVTTQGALGVV